MTKILITGASGFVGGFLVEEALNRDIEVYATVRKSSDRTYLQDPRINLIETNLSDVDLLSQLYTKHTFDYIIHNAGLTKSPSADQYFKVNCGILESMLDAVSKSEIDLKKFTFISSLAAYGPAEYTENNIVTEDSTPNPVTNYGRSKLKAEQVLKSHSSKVNYNIIRPTVVYGPREKDLFTVYDLMNKGLNLSVGMKDQNLTFIYVKDLVRVILDSTLSDKRNVAYFVTDLNVTKSSDFNELVKKTLAKKATLRIKVPIFLVRILGFISENIGKITGNYPPLNLEKVNELEAKSWVCDTSNLVTDLNYKPQYDLSSGLKESIAWYKENNWLK